MLLFKTSGKTFNSVISNQKHAFKGRPEWETGEIIIVSKNKNSCRKDEKQIQYIMYLDKFRITNDDEIERYWPNNKGRWKYIVDCYNTVRLQKPFNIEDVVGEEHFMEYGPVVTFKKIGSEHEE